MENTVIILDEDKVLDTTGDTVVILDEDKVLDTMEDVVVILDEGKVPRLIVTLVSILIAILIDTDTRFGTSAPGNPTPRIT